GISTDKILQTAEEAYVEQPESDEDVSEKLEAELEEGLSDLNVRSLILAGLRLEEDGRIGLIPGLTKEDFDADPV
ncbi:MAG: hypothetical protein ABEJ72_06590, partial [Candidatus Aenigmatarchaeota archaeon]